MSCLEIATNKLHKFSTWQTKHTKITISGLLNIFIYTFLNKYIYFNIKFTLYFGLLVTLLGNYYVNQNLHEALKYFLNLLK